MASRRAQDPAEVLTPLTIQQIDALLEFLPHLEAVARGGYEAGTSGISTPGTPQADNTWAFFKYLYDSGVIQGFEWMGWRRGAELTNSEELLAAASLNDLHGFLIMHTRMDRIAEGHFDAMVENGHFAKVLRRLKILHETLPEQG